MKKHLIALAVAGAVAAPAMAQNVSVYGVIDAGFNITDSQTNTADKTEMKSGTVSSSVIGFKGSEDLGGGLKAEFQLQGNNDVVNSGQVGDKFASNGADNTAKIFGDEAWVGLSSAAFGSVRLGTSDVTSAQGIDSMGASIFGNAMTASGQYGADKAGVIRYTSPTINGITVEVGQSSADSQGADSAAAADQNGFAVSYVVNPKLTVKLGSTQTEYNNSKDNIIGASYNFGAATVGLVRQNTKSDDAATEVAQTWLGVTVPMGNGLTAGAAMHVYNKDNSDSSDYKRIAVGVTKSLSKRTSVYAAYRDQKYDASSSSADVKTYAVGMIHSF
jgi:predicted porin